MVRRIQQCSDEELAISIITLAELQFGAYNSTRIENNFKRIQYMAKRVQLLDLTPATTDMYAQIKVSLRKIGSVVDDLDIFIGATAIENDLILVTDNERHFSRMSGLRIVNWMK
jgi:tRNA(fMet)-specific endonuclease VapC